MRYPTYSKYYYFTLLLIVVSLILSACSEKDSPTEPTTDNTYDILFLSDRTGTDQVFGMNADGSNQTRLVTDNAVYESPRWSPDGSKIVCARQAGGNWDIYLMNADGGNLHPLAAHAADDRNPVWSPDGSRIAFESWRDSDREIYVIDVDGTGLTRITNHRGEDRLPAWHPGGGVITYASLDTAQDATWRTRWAAANGTNQYLNTLSRALGGQSAWSPDGTKYFSCTSDHSELFVYNTETMNERLSVISPDTINSPSWSPDGSELVLSTPPAYPGNYAVAVFVFAGDNYSFSSLTGTTGNNSDPVWKRDMTQIAFCSDRDGNKEIYVMNADGSQKTNLTDNEADDWSPDWRNVP